MKVHVTGRPFDPWREIENYRRATPALAGNAGATTVFVGTMRDLSQGARVTAMTLEHYPGMTEKQLEAICREAAARWEILDMLVVHRYGALKPDEPIVLVAVWAAHRDPAFDTCRYIIDALKTRAPFWKREETKSGTRWVEP
ncbi:MAG: molybdenum cofactor biosynthesis protein MoaE [Gammaproteobacteria bacterium]|nr:molybdenum cofactor biosynthesis protein MoaE [Gammaproteobacteria bacterium]